MKLSLVAWTTSWTKYIFLIYSNKWPLTKPVTSHILITPAYSGAKDQTSDMFIIFGYEIVIVSVKRLHIQYGTVFLTM